MKVEFLNFLRKISILTIVLAAIAISMYYLIPHEYITYTLPYQLVFFLVVYLVVFYVMLKSSYHKKKVKFISNFMLSTTVKLLSFLAIILIYAFQVPADAIQFIITFFILYMIYTTFEIISILKLMRKTNDEPSSNR